MSEQLRKKFLLLLLLRQRRKRILKTKCKTRSKPKFWVRTIFKRREELGEYHRLVQELRTEDREQFFR